MKILRLAQKMLYTGLLTTMLLLPTISAHAEGGSTTTGNDYPWQISLQASSDTNSGTNGGTNNENTGNTAEAIDTSQQSNASSDPEWRYVPVRRMSY